MRAQALENLDSMRDHLLDYHKEVMAGAAKQANSVKEEAGASDLSESVKLDILRWQEEKHELQESLQEALRRNEELAMEMAQCRLQEAQLKRTMDQLKHHQVMTENQMQHQQAAQEAQRKQLQMKDALLSNYRTSIRTLENKAHELPCRGEVEHFDADCHRRRFQVCAVEFVRPSECVIRMCKPLLDPDWVDPRIQDSSPGNPEPKVTFAPPAAAHSCSMQRPAQKPWQFYFVMVFPNSAKIMHDELKYMVETTHQIQEKEIAYLTGIAAKHPNNNLPKLVSPFIAWFMTFLRRTNGLSLLVLVALVGAVVYLKAATAYGIFLNLPVLAVSAALVCLVSITPYLGWKGATHKNWVTLRYYDAAIICFLALLVGGFFGMEAFRDDIGNALLIQSKGDNHSLVTYGHSLLDPISNQTQTVPHPVTSFLQAELDKAFVVFLENRFEELFPKNESSPSTVPPSMMMASTVLPVVAVAHVHRRRALMSLDPRPWLAKTFNVTALFYPPPLKETPTWMKEYVATICANQTDVNNTLLWGTVQTPLEPTFDSCLRPILEACMDGAQYVQLFFMALAGLLVVQYLTLLLLKYIDPAAAAPQKKAMRKTSSLMHFFDVVLFVVGLVFLVGTGYGIYVAIAQADDPTTTTELRVVQYSGIAFCFIYGVLLCLSAAMACSPKLIRVQTFLLCLVVVFQFLLAAVLFVAKCAMLSLATHDFKSTRWDESIVLFALRHVFSIVESSKSASTLDFVQLECGIATMPKTLPPACQVQLATRFASLLTLVVNAAGVIMAVQVVLLVRNLYTIVVTPLLKKIFGKRKAKQRNDTSPLTVVASDDDAAATKEATLPFHTAMDKYWESFPRGCASETALAQARQHFTLEWLKVTGASSVHEKDQLLTMSQFESIVRVLVLKRLMLKCGLEVSVNISRDGKHIFFKLSAPRKVVAEEAEGRKYKLQFRNAVDPGPAFWTPREVKIENTIYDVQTAKQKLTALYGRHLLTVVENQFFPNESMAQVSRRINVHMREAMYHDDLAEKKKNAKKKMPKTYRYNAFAPYFRKNSMQYLYKRHSTQLDLPTTDVAPSVFQVTDCLKLLHMIVHDEFDTTRMLSNGLLAGFSCLHSASRFEWTNIVSLSSSWLAYWRPRHLPGEPDPDKHFFLNFLFRIYPFRQPLTAVREYFGEEIALYFSWLAFYAQCLMFPVLTSVVYVVLRHGNWHSYNPAGELEDMTLGLVVLVWAFVYAKCWQRKNYMVAIKWGMHGIEDEEEDRADYYGKEEVNPITNEVERVFPEFMRIQLQVASLLAVGSIAMAYVLAVIFLFSLQKRLVANMGVLWGVTLGSMLQVVVIQANSTYTSFVAHWLNERENYRTQSEFEHYLIMKLFGLRSLHHFAALVFTAFLKKSTFGCFDVTGDNLNLYQPIAPSTAAATGNCLSEMENLLLVIFGWRLASFAVGTVVPLVQLLCFNAVPLNRYDLEYELSLDVYDNTYEDYSEIVVQYGLLTLFIFPLPVGPIFAFLESAINLRMDAYKLCYCTRRPLPRNAQDIGAWFIYLMFLSRFCIATNLGFLFFTASNFATYSTKERCTFYLLAVAAALVVYEAAWFFVPVAPEFAANILERHEFLLQKYIYAHAATTTTSASTLASSSSSATKAASSMRMDKRPSLERYNDHALETLNDKVELLAKFNKLFVTKPETDDDEVEMAVPASFEPTDLTGIDAIREAVRRSTGLFADDDDDHDATDWYFAPKPTPAAPLTDRVPTQTSTHHATRGFVEDAELEDADDEFIIQDDDEDLADVL
ncbi:Aste57867_15443 [Aphanomyces stellatus]|uniref:Aste57867_15443 protein n=1 Tax=Aphanomyces stellatus TaxID=120398 RepID=A0A485L4H3_9STRA|nr:hypothetical protein As57867_015387 [Aphanomyces stellatus]VFT92245.1 Aste57867_15443 [Aphanomyces stellatus]